MTQSKEQKATLIGLLDEFSESESGAQLNALLGKCQQQVKGTWIEFTFENKAEMLDFLDLEEAIARAILAFASCKGFRVRCGRTCYEYDVSESCYYDRRDLYEEHLNSIYSYAPDSLAHNAVTTTECEITASVIEYLEQGSDDAPLQERTEFNNLLSFCIVDAAMLSQITDEWAVIGITVPCLSDAQVLSGKFANYIKSALTDFDSFYSVHIWIGSEPETRIWYDRIALHDSTVLAG
jgi:hypothetical protein